MDELVARKGRLIRVPNDFPTLVEALDAHAPGDCIFLAATLHELREPLMITKSCHIIGMDEMGTCATLAFNAQDLRPCTPLLRVDAAACKLQGLRFVYTCDLEKCTDTETTRASAVTVTRGDVIFDKCTVESHCTALKILPGAYVTLLSSVVTSRHTGVMLLGGRLYADRSAIRRCATGLAVTATGSAKLQATVVSGCSIGVDIRGHVEFQMQASVVEDCTACGIAIEDEATAPKPPSIRGSEFRRCFRGIYVRGAAALTDIAKNLFHDCVDSAVCIDGGVSTVAGNAIKDCKRFGIEVTEGRPTIDSNVVQSCGEAGIAISGLNAMPLVDNNELVHQKATGLLVSEGAAPHVDGNVFSDNARNMVLCGALGVYFGNRLHRSTSDSVHILLSTCKVVFESNEVLGSFESGGVSVTDGAHAIIAGNKFRETKVPAIQLRGCGSSDVYGNAFDGATCRAGAVVAQGGAIVRIGANELSGLAIDVQSDSVDTVTILSGTQQGGLRLVEALRL